MTENKDKLSRLIDDAISGLSLPEKPSMLYDPLRYALGLGGKRIRPRLTLLGCGLCGGDPEQAVPAALSVELLHNFTLIHDDIMDRADSRRGSPTVHEKWDHPAAILSGDVLFGIAWHQLAAYGRDSRYSRGQYLGLNELFFEAVQVVCEGQALDMEFEKRLEVTLDDYLHMISGKTASLLSCSLRMGALVAGATGDEIHNAGLLGVEAGLAFQIQDDLLDATGNPDKFGKRVGGDIYEGKKTWLSILALEMTSGREREKLQDILQSKHSTDQDVKSVIQLYHELGVIGETKKALESRYLNAISYLDKFADSVYKHEIKALLNQLKTRDT